MTMITPPSMTALGMPPQSRISSQPQNRTAADFNALLARATAAEPAANFKASAAAPSPAPNMKPISLGTLNARQATVSDLLSQHPEYKDDMWQIVGNPLNKAKPFRQIPSGTAIYLNPVTRELSWSGVPETGRAAGCPMTGTPLETESAPSRGATSQSPLNPVAIQPAPNPAELSTPRLTHLGQLSAKQPTVSHLLANHAELSRNTWEIIHAPQNRAKQFTTLPPGTDIYLNSATRELSWTTQTAKSAAVPGPGQGLDPPGNPSGETLKTATPASLPAEAPQMAHAVRSFLGQAYDSMDCYELVVNGLEKMGVRYLGKGGLQASLMHKAVRAGLPANSYLTGEGIIDATGSRLYAQTILAPKNSEQQIQRIINDLKPLLGQGDILSFSTPSRGHVGVVDRQQDMWTFINSGYLDHEMQARRPRKGVGEEMLNAEIRNWLDLASQRREPLHISLGRLEPDKLRTFHAG